MFHARANNRNQFLFHKSYRAEPIFSCYKYILFLYIDRYIQYSQLVLFCNTQNIHSLMVFSHIYIILVNWSIKICATSIPLVYIWYICSICTVLTHHNSSTSTSSYSLRQQLFLHICS